MPEQRLGEITELLQQWRDGNADAENELFDRLNPDLRRLAHYLMRSERKDHTLQATELRGPDLRSPGGRQESRLAESAAFFRYCR